MGVPLYGRPAVRNQTRRVVRLELLRNLSELNRPNVMMLCNGMKSIQERKAKRFSVRSSLSGFMRPLVSSLFITIFLLTTAVVPASSVAFAEAITFEPVKKESINVTGKIIDRYFFVEFSTLSFINPVSSEYFISAFENQQIPYNDQNKPVASVRVTCTDSHCSYALEAPITEVPYIVGIGSSHSVGTISATLNFLPGNPEGVPFTPSVAVAALGTNSVIASYQMPLGYRPIDSKAWVGIWEGEASSTVQPIGKADVDSFQSQSTQAINRITVLADTTYTVGFVSGPSGKDIVATVTIKTKLY